MHIGCYLRTFRPCSIQDVCHMNLQYSWQSLKQNPFFLNFLINVLRSLFSPLLSTKCAPLLPRCWAMRILEHRDDCNTQIKTGEGETCFKICDEYCCLVASAQSSVKLSGRASRHRFDSCWKYFHFSFKPPVSQSEKNKIQIRIKRSII